MSARQDTYGLLRSLHANGIEAATYDDAHALRRAQLTLRRWAERECGDTGDHASTAIERDEETGKPYHVVYMHSENKPRRYAIPDRERGALARVAAICARIGAHYYHQGDPRGCVLYVAREPLTDTAYNRGVACC